MSITKEKSEPKKIPIDLYKDFTPEEAEMVKKLFPRNKKYYWKRKRFLSFTLSLIGFIVLLPLMLIIALIVFIDDPHGSPIYKSIRIGRHGKEFMFYKFRTMIVGADKMKDELMKFNEADGPAFKMKNDPRITRIGGFLRRTSLDELPQLVNIVKGDMTIVGPRPPLPREVAQYNKYQMLRLTVTPGLTCHWQVVPQRNDVSFEEWVNMDLKYISQRTFKQDILLVLKTIKAVFRGSGR